MMDAFYTFSSLFSVQYSVFTHVKYSFDDIFHFRCPPLVVYISLVFYLQKWFNWNDVGMTKNINSIIIMHCQCAGNGVAGSRCVSALNVQVFFFLLSVFFQRCCCSCFCAYILVDLSSDWTPTFDSLFEGDKSRRIFGFLMQEKIGRPNQSMEMKGMPVIKFSRMTAKLAE